MGAVPSADSTIADFKDFGEARSGLSRFFPPTNRSVARYRRSPLAVLLRLLTPTVTVAFRPT